MFTKIANGILWFGVAVGFVLSIILGVLIGKEVNGGIGFLAGFGGCIATLIVFTGFGVIVEMANNIETSRRCLERLSNPSYAVSSSVPTGTASYVPTAAAADNDPGETQYWICSCGGKNGITQGYCMVCGAQRSGVRAFNPSPSRSWNCSSCGEPNDEFSYVCKKCHRPKY